MDSWIIEAGDALHWLCEKRDAEGRGAICAAGMSYERLRVYRDRLTEMIYAKVRSGIAGPREKSAPTS